MTQQSEKLEQPLDIIRDQHKALLLQVERSEEVDLVQVRIFLKTLAQGGATIDDAEDRVLLHELIRYWSSFISDKTGEFPVVQLQPFDGHKVDSTGKNAPDATNGEQMETGTPITPKKEQGEELQNMLVAKLSEINSTLATSMAQEIGEQRQAAQDLNAMLNALLTQQIAEQSKLSQEVIQAANTLEASSTAHGSVVQSLGQAITEQTQVLRIMQGIQGEQRRLIAEMAATAVEMKNVFKTLGDIAPSLHSMAVDIDKFVQALRRIPQDLNADLLAPLQKYSSAAAEVKASSETLGRAAQYLESVTKKLDART